MRADASESRATGLTSPATSAPDAPRPVAPVQGALVDASAAAFQWEPVAGAEDYEVQIADDPGFGGEVLTVASEGPAASLTVYGTLAPDDDRDLYWRVRAAGRAAWSRPARFRAATDAAVAAFQAEQERQAAARAKAAAEQRERRRIEADLVPLYERDQISNQQVGLILLALGLAFVVVVAILLTVGQVAW